MQRAQIYEVLSLELASWSQLPRAELAARFGLPAHRRSIEIAGENITVEVGAKWASPTREAIRIQAIANGPSSWQLQRIEEGTTVASPT